MPYKHFITTTPALITFVEELATAPFIALDTEFHREKTYFPELCLIQVASPTAAAAIDPLAEGLDLTPLLTFLTQSAQPKVFHAGRQDLEIFWQLTNTILTPVFDTQIAALALGYGEQISYTHLIERVLGKRLSKAQQLTNWKNRPLSEKQLHYALDDVLYLRAAYPKIHDQLRAKGRLGWLEEEEARLTSAENFTPTKEALVKNLRLKDTSALAHTALEHLALWRDTTAQKENKPRHHVIKDDGLLILAQSRPLSEEEAQNLRMISADFIRRYGAEVLHVLNHVCSLPRTALSQPEKRLRVKNTTDSLAAKLANLLIAYYAEKESITPRLIANTNDVEEFVNGRPSPLQQGWRYALVGQEIERLMAGDVSLKVQGNQLRIIKTEEKN